jgi:hypothetical protein
MSETLAFDNLVEKLHRVLEGLPDYRTGQNTTYLIKDAALGAFSVFFTQAPSFLAHQQTMKRTKGRSNAESLLGIENIPCDNQIRQLLDPIAPSYLLPMFGLVFDDSEATGLTTTCCLLSTAPNISHQRKSIVRIVLTKQRATVLPPISTAPSGRSSLPLIVIRS